MQPDDRHDFAEAMAVFLSIYGMEVTDLLLDAWWGALESYPLQRVIQAMNAHATDPEAGMYRPTIAHVIRHLTDTLPRREREARNRRLAELRARIRPLDDARYRAAHDLRLGLITQAEYQRRVEQATRDILAIRAEYADLLMLEQDVVQPRPCE